MGGNLVQIVYNDNISELHALWDSVIGYMQDDPERPLTEAGFNDLGNKVKNIMKEFPRELFSEHLADPDPTNWTIEGFIDASLYAYNGIKEGERPSDEYLKKALNIAKRRIALGGYRLADIFMELYGSDCDQEQVLE